MKRNRQKQLTANEKALAFVADAEKLNEKNQNEK